MLHLEGIILPNTNRNNFPKVSRNCDIQCDRQLNMFSKSQFTKWISNKSQSDPNLDKIQSPNLINKAARNSSKKIDVRSIVKKSSILAASLVVASLTLGSGYLMFEPQLKRYFFGIQCDCGSTDKKLSFRNVPTNPVPVTTTD